MLRSCLIFTAIDLNCLLYRVGEVYGRERIICLTESTTLKLVALHKEIQGARFVDDPKGREQIAAIVPMGRLGNPEEAGELIAFLASGRSRFMTGQVINFTGGWP